MGGVVKKKNTTKSNKLMTILLTQIMLKAVEMSSLFNGKEGNKNKNQIKLIKLIYQQLAYLITTKTHQLTSSGFGAYEICHLYVLIRSVLLQ